MGVAGCGKSSLGRVLSHAMAWPLIEGDDFHSESNRAKMRSGIALTDTDRQSWLTALAAELAGQPHVVLTCSALKRSYRDQLRAASPGLRFVFLDLSEAAARERVAQRSAHLFPPTLVASQFATLERPDNEAGVLRLDATQPTDELLKQALHWLGASQPNPPDSTGHCNRAEKALGPVGAPTPQWQ